VVTMTVSVWVAQPVWQLAQAPGMVTVGVVLPQQASLGGTEMVVVDKRRQRGTGPQVLGSKDLVPEHAGGKYKVRSRIWE
jgi:hypothetical protein